MNLRTVNIIIRREYLNKVKKKSFLVTTFLVPILFALLCTLPSLIMIMAKEESKTMAVLDESGIVMPYLTDVPNVEFREVEGVSVASLKSGMDSLGVDAVLYISPLDTAARTVSAVSYAPKPLGVEMTEDIEDRINDAVESYRIGTYDIEGLAGIMESVKPDVKLVSYKMDESGNETLDESGIYMLLSMFLGMLIYMFISMFSGMVMSSVIEEKSSRVVEVLVSSVKATELLFGKIIGVALVALTQFFMWIVLTVAILAVMGGVLGTGFLSEMASSQMDPDGMAAVQTAAQPSEMTAIFSTLASVDYVQLGIVFILFFVFGYLLYASLLAAVGSAVENEADSQQLILPLTIPLMIGFFIAMFSFKAPDSGIVFWGSMIPFTSPMVMLPRVLFGVSTWEIALSVVILVLTFVFCAWLSAKIYKVGILTFGKKPTFRDLWKWLKMR